MPERPRDGDLTRAEDLVAAYELGLLDESDRARVEAASLRDPELLDDLYDAAPDAMLLAQDPGRYAAAARAGLAAGAAADRPTFGARLRALWRPRVLIPVATALVIMVAIVGPERDAARLADLAVVAPIAATRQDVRADTPDAEARFRQAMDAYLDARWDDAARLLDDALVTGGPGWPRTDQAHLYRGSSLLLAGDAAAATGELEQAATSSLPPVSEQARWQLAHARLVLGDATGAREALVGLTESPVLGEQATALLAELDAR